MPSGMFVSLKEAEPSLANLRESLPLWSWKAQRLAFGWEYVGRKMDREVTVRRVAILDGDDETTRPEWVVYENGRGEGFWSWLSRESRRRSFR